MEAKSKLSKRNRVRQVLFRPASSFMRYSKPVLETVTSPIREGKNVACSRLHEALQMLDRDEREIVQSLLPANDVDIDIVLERVYECAKEIERTSREPRWGWDRKEHHLCLSDQVGKMLKFLDKFKAVGDVIANVDPLHLGLPWAGIRIVLEVALSDSRQKATLINGIELSLFMINRLRVYWETHARSRPSPASENFNRTLIKLQSHILGFLARAIRVQRMRGASKLAQIIWDNDKLTQFENTCNSLCIRASEEARICDSEQGEQWREEFSRQLKGLDEIHGVRTDLERLYDKVDLTRLLIAGNAVYNSSAEADQCRCMPGTRTELLESITAWAVNPSSKPIFWLCGKAGTGKSTVARSVAHKLEEKGLHSATFFFKRGQTDRTHSNLLIPTIVSQLADAIPEIRHPIAGALDRDSLICHKNMRSQFHKLMSQPLQQAQWDSISSAGIILVIDALDECDNGEDMKSFLLLVSRVQTETIVPLRTFVTSRPELPVELGFKNMPGNLHHEVRLEEVQSTTIKRDIRTFYESQLHDIRENSALYGDELPCDWPSDGSINFLVDQTAPLFILASTICRYISADPMKNLAMIMQHRRINPSIGLQTTYLPILESISGETNGSQRKQKLVDFKNIVGSIISLLDPLSASALAKLLGVRVGEIGRVLRPLHSVLSIPRAEDGRFDYKAPITVFHQSFADYLIDPELNFDNPFMIDVAGTHDMLGLRCIRLLEAGCLREDICGVSEPGIRRQSVTASIIGTALPDDIIYCCRHWHRHFIRSGRPIEDEGSVHQFLRKHLLHWMEALGWLGNMSDVIRSLEDLRSAVNVRHDPKICNQSDMLTSLAKGTSGKELLLLLTDACKFATRNRYIIDQAPLQTYVSALLFAPSKSIIRLMFEHLLLTRFTIMPCVPEQWGPEILKLEGHHEAVNAVAFSTDHTRLGSVSDDQTVRIWDALTGEGLQKLVGHHDVVCAIAFSPDGRYLITGSKDRTVRVWETTTGKEMWKLEGHNDQVCAVAFSADGRTASSGSSDKTIRIWNLATGTETLQLEGHESCVNAVAISPNGKMIASGAEEGGIILWDAATGQERMRLEGHDRGVNVLTFSHESEMLASGSADHTVRIWNLLHGSQVWKLEGHSDAIRTVAFSPRGTVVASGSDDKTVQLWDMTTGERRWQMEGHDNYVWAMSFSPQGDIISSGPWNHAAGLWDMPMIRECRLSETDKHGSTAAVASQIRRLRTWGANDKKVKRWDNLVQGHGIRQHYDDECVWAVAFSLDGKTLASGSWDGIVRLWDTTASQKMQKLRGHDDLVVTIKFSLDGKEVMSASWDKTVILWDALTGRDVQKILPLGGMSHSLNDNLMDCEPHGGGDKLSDGAIVDKCRSRQSPESSVNRSSPNREREIHVEDPNDWARFEEYREGTDRASDLVSLESSWIRYRGREILWLPHEYRGNTYDVFGQSIVVGQASGAVSFITFK